MAKFIKSKKKGTNSVSKILVGDKIIGASMLPGSKYIGVYDGYKNTYIPKTSANIKKLNEKFGKPDINNYRGQKRKTWLDRDIF